MWSKRKLRQNEKIIRNIEVYEQKEKKMTIEELRYKVITNALKKFNNNAELAAKEIGVTARTIYTFKAEQKKLKELKQ
jgi:transcriptional regulator with PAS, ATPase and Fis domain